MEDDQRALDLVKELVQRLIHNAPLNKNPNPQHYNEALKYSIRILSSRMTPSIATDAAAVAESIKRRLATSGNSPTALIFADLYTQFSLKNGPGSVQAKWAVLYLLKTISEDRNMRKSSILNGVSNGLLDSALAGGLPTLVESETRRLVEDFSRGLGNLEKSRCERKLTTSVNDSGDLKNFNGLEDSIGGSRGSDNVKKLKSDSVKKLYNSSGVLVVSKDPENIRDLAYKAFADLVKDENEVSEAVLVRDILYACQGVDGMYVKFDKKEDAYVLEDIVKVSRATRIMIRKLSELGCLFRKINGYVTESMDRYPTEDVGTIGQAFCAALQDNLSDYYKLLAVLEAQAMNPIPFVSERSGNYLSLRRLSVWFSEPMVKMRLMAVLVDSCRFIKGGAMAGVIHMHAQHGDPLVNDFMKRLLRRVCSPLFEMVRSWVLEGELEDLFGEFFVFGQPVNAESLWREGYRLHDEMLPSFISQSLAQQILRTGKSINFLRVCCEDRGWADAATEAAAAAGTSTMRGGLGYGETDALEILVTEASRRIDKHLLDVMHKRYKFKEHCLAIKRYLLLGQGDFVQYLMDIVGPELSEPANTSSTFKLAGLLETAIRSSNAQYDDPDILDRLRVKLMPSNRGDRGWDVFSLDYDARMPLNTVFTETVMSMYLKIFSFLWKLRRVEHALIGVWKNMKPNCVTSRYLARLPQAIKLQLILTSRKCQVLWGEMNHFISNLQYYIMFEVLEESWSNLSKELDAAEDLDDLLGAHEKYLSSIVEKSLLGEKSQILYKTLLTLFDLIMRFRSQADRLYEGINELQLRNGDSSQGKARSQKSSINRDPGPWLGEGRKELTRRAEHFLQYMGHDIDSIAKDYSSVFESFISQLPMQQHVDLKFLMFRLDFTEFYSNLRPGSSVKLSL